MVEQNIDPELLAATDLARAALLEVEQEQHIGEFMGHEADESGAVTLFFASTLPGYPGWRWAATVAKASPDAQPTVLEVEMLPGEGALLSPEWVPWSERLAQYRESQAALEDERRAALEAAAELGEEDEFEEDGFAEDIDDVLDDVLDEVDELDDDELDGDDDDDDLDGDDDDDDDLDGDILVNDFSDFDDEIDGVDVDSIDLDSLQEVSANDEA